MPESTMMMAGPPQDFQGNGDDIPPSEPQEFLSTNSKEAEKKLEHTVSFATGSCLGWSCFSSREELDRLSEALNPRGIREGELKKKIDLLKGRFEGTNKGACLFAGGDRVVPSARPKYNSAPEFFELYLREQILDIEEKIHIGNLGYISDRAHWRNSIECSGAAATLLPPGEGVVSSSAAAAATNTTTTTTTTNSSSSSLHSASSSHSASPSAVAAVAAVAAASGTQTQGNINGFSTPLSVVQELGSALLQVQAGIGKKFLMPPLGTAIDKKKKQQLRGGKKSDEVKESDVCLEQWRSSLGKATSFSQVFLHLATLERAVMWSKSLMNVRCRICRRKCGDEFMLLCDGCDHGYHTYCLKPPLKEVPEGDWFCYDCMPVTPVKPRRRVQRVLIIEESSESEAGSEAEFQETEEEEEEEEAEEEGEEEEEKEDEEGGDDMEDQNSVQSDANHVGGRGRGRWGRGRGRGRRGSRRGRGKRRGRGRSGCSGVGRSNRDVDDFEEELAAPPPPKRGRGRAQPSDGSGSTKVVGMRARKKLKLGDPPTPADPQGVCTTAIAKAEGVISSIIELRCTRGGRPLTGASRRELKNLEMQLCQALWEEVDQQPDSWHFAVPVKKKEYEDYFDVVEKPMDLRTVKTRIKSSSYKTIDEFLEDMLLIFSNSVKYHKKTTKIGKAAKALRAYFEKRCSDLGLKDLRLSTSNTFQEKTSGIFSNQRRSSRRKN